MPPVKSKQILVIESESLTRWCLENLLASLGTVHCACNWKEAEELLQRHAFNLVISSHRHPGFPGIKFLHASSALQKNIRTLLLSSHAEELGEHTGIDAIMDKPFEKQVLQETVSHLLGNLS